MRSRGVCPECGLPGIPYLYGLPSGEGMEAVNAGLVVLGGCVIYDGMPSFRCPRGHEWEGPGEAPAGDEAAQAYASGRFEDAERAYRALLDGATEDSDVYRRALTAVLSNAGRADEAAEVFAPIRRREQEEKLARLHKLMERRYPR